jgi:D-alanine--poly(phosphoribitol) ligase subunit 2
MHLNKIHEILRPHLKGKAVTDDTPLISGGLIDSMAIVDLIIDLEAALGIRIPASEVEPDDFDTPRRILATIERFS